MIIRFIGNPFKGSKVIAEVDNGLLPIPRIKDYVVIEGVTYQVHNIHHNYSQCPMTISRKIICDELIIVTVLPLD